MAKKKVKQRGPGRPSLGDDARTIVVATKWSARDLELLDAAAAALDVTRSTLIHDAAIAKAKRAVRSE